MVSQRSRDRRPSRDRILDAAAVEFAARGFDGAKVDRIAARAGVNKAMLYYHFRNKADLYRAVLRDVFQAIASAVAGSRTPGGTPADQLRGYIRALAAESASRPHLPSLWLREMAEGGRHLDASVIGHLTAVLGVLAGITRGGRDAGAFGDVHPFVLQLGIVAPLLMFTASAPLRERFARDFPPAMASVTRDDLVRHVETSALAALASAKSTRGDVRRPARARKRSGRE